MSVTLVEVSRRLSGELAELRFSAPVTHVYDPQIYAADLHERYLRAWGSGTGRVVLVGMNPGPFGMAQTGVPFGEIEAVRDWMGLDGVVGRPDPEHPKRPVLGLANPRREVSGQRLWGWARSRHGTPDAFFARYFVINWCPLCFLEASGRNRTPDKLGRDERAALFPLCDRALRSAIVALAPRAVVGVGGFAEERAREALDGLDLPIGRVLHPSPANPKANAGWEEQADRELSRWWTSSSA